MRDNGKGPGGAEVPSLQIAHGALQDGAAQALDISPRTFRRPEHEARGQRIQTFLEGLSATPDDSSAGVQSIRAFIREHSVPGGRPLGLAYHELAALLECLPAEQRSPAVQTFVDVHRQLEDASIDPLKTLEAAAQVTIKAYSQFRSHEAP